MKKMLLIDGNSMLFRAYYATLYTRMMKTSNGIPTNAVFGFINMLNKAMEMIKPEYVLVAWDSGKPTFRHETYTEYKGTRKKLDDDLIVQFPIVREYLDAYGLFRFESEGIEADDIIGSMAKKYPEYEIHILSSDKDLLQLIDPTTDVYLMKKGISEIEVVNEEKLMETMGIVPSQIIDLKALMGDTADNIPGVPGIGEKTALKLLQSYQTVDGVYEHLEEQKGKLKEKLETGKDKAFLSKFLATIRTDFAFPFEVDELVLQDAKPELNEFFMKYEMNSFIKKMPKEEKQRSFTYHKVKNISQELLCDHSVLWFDYDCEDHFHAKLYGFAIGNQTLIEYITLEDAKQDGAFMQYLASNKHKVICDVKNIYHICERYDIVVDGLDFDVVIAGFLLDGTIHDYEDLIEKYKGDTSLVKEEVYGKKGKPKEVTQEERLAYVYMQTANIASLWKQLKKEVEDKEMLPLLRELEMPLAKVLFQMEKNGVCTDLQVLHEIAENTAAKIEALSKEIYAIAGHEFNINSPKQLAIVLYDELGLKAGKKRSTAVDVLEKLMNVHPIIPLLMEQRKYQKIYSTYAVGLSKHVHEDGKIHTIFNQTLTQTGRLSSSEPNLQNISVRDEEGKEIRRAFVASPNHILMSADYSQIELRMLAHMAQEDEMIDAFHKGIDIHTKTAMQIFGVAQEDVDDMMRRSAKTVNFGIVYGQTDFGLSEQLGITRKEAKEFIDRYFASYPKIHAFMDQTIQFCEEHGYVKTLFQRRRYIPEIHDKNYMTREFGKRAAMNAPIQGSAADLIKKAMIRIADIMQEKGVKSSMILQIHDELIFDVCEDEIELMKTIIEEGMQHAMELKVPLLAEANIGPSWFEAK